MSDCILTTNGKIKGYGAVHIGNKTVYEHRLVYCLANNLSLEDIVGLVVRHTCDNPSCVNPEHLLIGTQQDNVDDREARGRGNQRCPVGEENGYSKLTEKDVLEIRAHRRYSQRELAKMYNVHQATIMRVLNRTTWKHVK